MIERNIHHAGKIPSRTCLASPVLCRVTGKWSAVLETWYGFPGSEHRATKITSGSLFDTETEAYSAGDRAMDVLQQTDKLPNLCEPW